MSHGEWIVASQTKAKGQAKGELSSPFLRRIEHVGSIFTV